MQYRLCVGLGLIAGIGVVVSALWFVIAGFFVGGMVLYLPLLFVGLGCGMLGARVVCGSRLDGLSGELERMRDARCQEGKVDWLFESDLGLDVDEVELIEQWVDMHL